MPIGEFESKMLTQCLNPLICTEFQGFVLGKQSFSNLAGPWDAI